MNMNLKRVNFELEDRNMDKQNETEGKALKSLFYSFIDAGLHGRYEEALSYLGDKYTGVGMGEQGIVRNKNEAKEILKDSYIPGDESCIEFRVNNFIIHMLSEEVAMLVGEIHITNTSAIGKPMYSGLVQTIGAKFNGDHWRISFTHASPTVLSVESVEAYPIRFLDKTLSRLKADIQMSGKMHVDFLTGILNRKGFDLLTKEVMKDYNSKYNTALFMIDLDDFKQINDRLGHQTGDMVLQQVAKVLQHTFREEDVIGRIGGDEFMVLLKGVNSVKSLEKKADEVIQSMCLQVGGKGQMSISVSIGIAYGQAKATFEEYYRIADIALYSAKKAGKSQYNIINVDTNSGHSRSSFGVNFISLQTLLDYTKGNDELKGKTPYETLMENIPCGIVVYEFIEKEIKVDHCNDWFCKFIGYSEEELYHVQKDNPYCFIHPDDMEIVLKGNQSIRDGEERNEIVYRVLHKEGHYVYMNQVLNVTKREKNCIIMYGIETDVSEVITLRQEVEDAHRKLDALLANSSNH